MDGYEATKTVFSRIQSLDRENASKIMGLLLIQDHGEKEMIRLAFGPEALLHSVILKARKELGLVSNSPSAPTTPSSSPSPFNYQVSRQNSASSRLSGVNLQPFVKIPNFSNPDELSSPNGSSLNPSSLPFYGNRRNGRGSDGIDEFQLQDQLTFLNEKNHDLIFPQTDLASSPTGGCGGEPGFPPYWGGSAHRRTCSVNDALVADDPASGLGFRPCLYFARGYCKNGSNCKFVHGGLGEAAADCGSPSKIDMMEQCYDMLRSKNAQQQRLSAASQLMNSSNFPYTPRAAAALMMGDDMCKLNRSRLERNGFLLNGEGVNPASRQIYLTFPADSTFREEDVSNYFSIYGPVQDVRIPYQQKRMFGFVTFLYPETVKMILAKGNPHFVCDARVLVKPYKEKGKVLDKKQQMERGEFSPCGTPTGIDARDPFDLGTRMQAELLWRRKLEEQADLQQALELQSRRLMNLQLLDVKKHHHHRALSNGSPLPSPTPHSPHFFNHHSLSFPPFHGGAEVVADNCSSPIPPIPISAPPNRATGSSSEESGSGKESPHYEDDINLPESLEHYLPDSPFASPAKRSNEFFSPGEAEKDASNNNMIPANNSLDMASASFKSFNCQIPRFPSGHGAIGIGGPTCPVGI